MRGDRGWLVGLLGRGDESRRLRLAGEASVLLFGAASTLALKAAWDVMKYGARFPGWFGPVFIGGTVSLVVYAAYVTARVLRRSRAPRFASGSWSHAIWVLLGASFVSVTAVHRFFPFVPTSLRSYLALRFYPIWAVNGGLAVAGLGGTVGLARLYRKGYAGTALLGLGVLGLLLLIPNDECRNPFNSWWLATVGASPLMFVPNMFALIVATAALLGVHPRLNAALVAAICLSTLLLGIGHMTRIIW